VDPTKRVLVVDDDENHAMTISDILGAFGFEVDVANNGADALGLNRKKKYDYALLDIRMPGMSGVDILKEIKGEKGESPKTFMMTAYCQNGLVNEARKEGAIDVLEKPLDLSLLIHYFSENAAEC
jgi:two-component system response regulator HydG